MTTGQDDTSGPVDPDQIERRRQCLDLRLKGRTYREIALEIEVPRQTAWRWVHAEISEMLVPLADEVRKRQFRRLEILWKGLAEDAEGRWEDALGERAGGRGWTPSHVLAAERLMDREAKLTGLDLVAAPPDFEPVLPSAISQGIIDDRDLRAGYLELYSLAESHLRQPGGGRDGERRPALPLPSDPSTNNL